MIQVLILKVNMHFGESMISSLYRDWLGVFAQPEIILINHVHSILFEESTISTLMSKIINVIFTYDSFSLDDTFKVNRKL